MSGALGRIPPNQGSGRLAGRHSRTPQCCRRRPGPRTGYRAAWGKGHAGTGMAGIGALVGPRRHFWRATSLVSQTRCGDWRWFGPEFSRVRREGSVARDCVRGTAPRRLAASARVHQHGGYKGCRCYLTLKDRGGSWLEKGFGSLGWGSGVGSGRRPGPRWEMVQIQLGWDFAKK